MLTPWPLSVHRQCVNLLYEARWDADPTSAFVFHSEYVNLCKTKRVGQHPIPGSTGVHAQTWKTKASGSAPIAGHTTSHVLAVEGQMPGWVSIPSRPHTTVHALPVDDKGPGGVSIPLQTHTSSRTSCGSTNVLALKCHQANDATHQCFVCHPHAHQVLVII